MKNLELVDISNIILNENAYFYKKKRDVILRDIQIVFREARDDKNANRKYQVLEKESLFDGSKEIAKYSLDIFEFKSKPSFFKEDEPDKRETKYGFFLILEYKNYISIIRKNVSGVKHLYSFAESIDYQVLAYFLITNKTKFEKIVSNGMNMADNAIQIKRSEANDLKGIYSRFGASKQILNSIRLDNDGNKHAISLNTSRVNSFNLKNDFEKVLFWMIETIKHIDKAFKHLPESPFLDGFATPLKFEDVKDNLEPSYAFLRFNNLLSDIEDGSIEKCYHLLDKKESKIDIQKLINDNPKLYKLSKVDSSCYENGSLSVIKNKFSISIQSEEFKSIYIKYSNDDNIITLNQYLNVGNNFMINFDKIDHVYSHRKVFKDSKLLGDLENFFKTFIPCEELKEIDSEKGENYKSNSTHYKEKSLFRFIEDKFVDDSLALICDDLGKEWGDFISIKDEKVTFYHAKYSKDAFSASNLEVVFGQAQKNFGFLELTEEMINYRKDRWSSDYKIDGVQTGISRIRKCSGNGNKIEKIKELSNSVSSNANTIKEVYIVINYLSKSELKSNIYELKNGNTFDNQGVTMQILWFVNSLLSSANELDVVFKILCRP